MFWCVRGSCRWLAAVGEDNQGGYVLGRSIDGACGGRLLAAVADDRIWNLQRGQQMRLRATFVVLWHSCRLAAVGED
jgi:hypothetical protein